MKRRYLPIVYRITREAGRCVFDLALVILSYVVPKNDDLYLFTSHHGDLFKGNPRYLYKYFEKKKKKVVWITTKKSLESYLKKQGINVVFTVSPRGMWRTLRAKYIFVDNGVRGPFLSGALAFLGRFNIIQTWHGSGWKNIALLDDNFQGIDRIYMVLICKSFNLILASSEVDQKHFRDSFKNENVVITGLPRNDIFFNEELRYKNYKGVFGLDKYEKVILYAPTFRERYETKPFTSEFLKELDEFLLNQGYIMLLKKHPQDHSLIVPNGLKRIRDITGDVDDIQELLPDIDILITDYSSISVDFAITGKPIIFYTYDMDKYLTECRSTYYDIREILPGPFASTEHALLDLLKDMSWFETPDYKKKYKKFRDLFHKYKDGKACERVEKILEN